MIDRTPLAQRVDAALDPDPRRVVFRLFLPGEVTHDGRSRVGAVIARVLALPEDEVAECAAQLHADFWVHHEAVAHAVERNALLGAPHVAVPLEISADRRLVLGAALTAGYAVEGAALCNPSAVPHPDQSGLAHGQARVAMSVRGIGEGHVSSIEFVSAVVGPGAQWAFEPRVSPAVVGTVRDAPWRREHLRELLEDAGRLDDLAYNVLALLPDPFSGADLETALTDVHAHLLAKPDANDTSAVLRRLVASVYGVSFPADVRISQQVLMPHTADESHGMEDARFVRFTDDDGTVDYRATYTAYDGRAATPRLLTSADLRSFSAGRLAGPSALTKGMALFPRRIDGRYWAMSRSDGESNCVASSPDGIVWGEPETLQAPVEAWELVQIGNCGPPLETDRGWLVLTHGVGPMRTYSIGAILLDLDDPSRVVGRLRAPLLETREDERYGYVPHVLYSCGGIVHDELLWIPYGASDQRVRVAWLVLDDLLERMVADHRSLGS